MRLKIAQTRLATIGSGWLGSAGLLGFRMNQPRPGVEGVELPSAQRGREMDTAEPKDLRL